MKIKELLEKLDLGSSVAEFDTDLDSHFLETTAFKALTSDLGDTVAGDKGTGKSALYRILSSRYRKVATLKETEVLPGFNPTGSPVFQRLTEGDALSEGQYITIWKAYVLSLVGNWILQIYDGTFSSKMKELDEILRKTELRTADDSPNTVFARLINTFKRITNPKAAEVKITASPHGIPILVPRVEFDKNDTSTEAIIDHRVALGTLNDVLRETNVSAWIILDRLDEAFQGFPNTEVPALRALLRTYLDLLEFDRIKLKLFIRNDLFRRIIGKGFVNLTHINARKISIVWEDDDLLNLLFKRISKNPEFLRHAGLSGKDRHDVLSALFPEQIDAGERKSETWPWIISRIRDGNYVKPPRNIIDLIKKAQQAEIRKQERDPREYRLGEPIISAESVKKGLASLSQERVEDTLLAEAGELSPIIETFRDGKAEHNEHSIAKLLGLKGDELKMTIRGLIEIGFIEEVGETYKVPMLYRGGLGITQGKAF